MKEVQIQDKHFDLYIGADKIDQMVSYLAKEVGQKNQGKTPLFLCILNGSFVFAADFIRKYEGRCEVSFVKFSSYKGSNSTGEIKSLLGINEDLDGRDIIILEDIIDTGLTLQHVYDTLNKTAIKSLQVVSLFFKPTVFKKELHIDHVGFSIEDEFIVGYGLDYNGEGRNLKHIYKLKSK